MKNLGVRGKYAITSGKIPRFRPTNALHSQLADVNGEYWIPIPYATLFNSEKPKVCWIRGHKVCPLIQPTFGSFLNNYPNIRIRKRRIPSPLQKAGAWRFQLAPYKRRDAGDHAGTIPGADAGVGDRIQAPDPGSAAQRSPVIHCAKRRNLKIFSGSPTQIQWKLSTSGFHTIHSLKSTPQRSAAVWISTLKNWKNQ